MSKEMDFYIYLMENYAAYKGKHVKDVVKLLDDLELTDFIYNMYEMYHIESIENAYADIDRLISEKTSKQFSFTFGVYYIFQNC